MNRFRKVAENIMSHHRDIRFELFQDKVVYSIPKYLVCERFLYTPKVDIKDHYIDLSFMLKEPTSHHSAKSSYESCCPGRERTDETGNSFQ